MNIHLASHYGMCFGVRDALQLARRSAARAPLTILGQLVHNPVVTNQFEQLGAFQGKVEDAGPAPTRHVLITAHGASQSQRERWRSLGHDVIDTTCPLVRRAHEALAALVSQGCHPVVIGSPTHVEVRGLVGDFPGAIVVAHEQEVAALPFHPRFGIVSQTTQPQRFVEEIVTRIRALHPSAEVRWIDTVCRPTKDRQDALERLCQENSNIVVIGGRNSNNTRQLLQRARALGCRACQVETAGDLDPAWFAEVTDVGVTAGTSTLPETIEEILTKLREISRGHSARAPLHS